MCFTKMSELKSHNKPCWFYAAWLNKPMNRFQREAQTDWRFPEGVVYKSPYELVLITVPKIATAHTRVGGGGVYIVL